MTNSEFIDSFFNRLRLIVDLANKGEPLLQPQRNDSDAIHGLVLLDQAFELCMGVATDHLKRDRGRGRFHDLLAKLPEIDAQARSLEFAHCLRNQAQHQGIPPPQQSRASLNRDIVNGLRKVFALVGSDFDRFSSVPQVKTQYFRELLEAALKTAESDLGEALLNVQRVFYRVNGWVKHVIGNATVPEEMWVYETPLWEETRFERVSSETNTDVMNIALSVASGAALGMNYANLVRLQTICADQEVAATDITWAVEAIARSVIYLENEWPDFLLVYKQAGDEKSR